MTTDMSFWRNLVVDQVSDLADRAFQKQAWFGKGPGVSSPVEQISMFFDNARVPDYLNQPDNGLTDAQHDALLQLSKMMESLIKTANPEIFQRASFFNNPEWESIRLQASMTRDALKS